MFPVYEACNGNVCELSKNYYIVPPALFPDDITMTADGVDTYHIVKAAKRYK